MLFPKTLILVSWSRAGRTAKEIQRSKNTVSVLPVCLAKELRAGRRAVTGLEWTASKTSFKKHLRFPKCVHVHSFMALDLYDIRLLLHLKLRCISAGSARTQKSVHIKTSHISPFTNYCCFVDVSLVFVLGSFPSCVLCNCV